jgi:DNA invertase Pin-like site-specific DNA recombinase
METSEQRPRAFSYLRFSTPEQAKGDSRNRQATMAEEYALEHGLVLDTELTYNDLGVSGFKGLNSESGRLADFRRAVQDGLVPVGSYLLVEGLDRLSRLVPRKALRVLEDILELGITVITLNDRRKFTSENLDNDPLNLLVAIMTFMRANEESESKSKRVAKAWESKRKRLLLGDASEMYSNKLAFWLANRHTPIPEKVAIVERIYSLYAAGNGAETISRQLNEESVPSPRGLQWNTSSVKKLLDSPSVEGHLQTKEGLIENALPPILDPKLIATVRKIRASSAKGRKGSSAVHPFSGLLKCANCEGTIIKTNKGPHWQYLCCSKAKIAAAGPNGQRCSYISWPYQSALALLKSHMDEIDANADTALNTAEVFECELELEKLYDEVRIAYELYRQDTKSLMAKQAWQESESKFQEAKLELQRLIAANKKPSRQATSEAIDRVVSCLASHTPPSNADMRTLFTRGTADLRKREMVLYLHDGLKIALNN